MADTFPVDFTTEVGRVRKYIPDLIQLPDPRTPDGPKSFIFSDDELASFILDEKAVAEVDAAVFHIRRAAASAMIALANNENLILKKIVTEDQETDGPAVARALIAAAQALLKRAEAEELAAYGAEFFIIPRPAYPSPPFYAELGRPIFGVN